MVLAEDIVALDEPRFDHEIVSHLAEVLDLDPVGRPGLDLDPPDAAGAVLAEADRIVDGGSHGEAHEVEVDIAGAAERALLENPALTRFDGVDGVGRSGRGFHRPRVVGRAGAR